MDRDEKLFRCWNQGFGIGATYNALRKNGTPMDKDAIQKEFAALAGRYGGYSCVE